MPFSSTSPPCSPDLGLSSLIRNAFSATLHPEHPPRKERSLMGEREKILDYLDAGLSEPIRDPVWKHIYLAPAHEKIISLPVFQELHDIKQLGPGRPIPASRTVWEPFISPGASSVFWCAETAAGFLRWKGSRPFSARRSCTTWDTSRSRIP